MYLVSDLPISSISDIELDSLYFDSYVIPIGVKQYAWIVYKAW